MPLRPAPAKRFLGMGGGLDIAIAAFSRIALSPAFFAALADERKRALDRTHLSEDFCAAQASRKSISPCASVSIRNPTLVWPAADATTRPP